ncbi:MAG: hypothetical protein E6Q97_17310 [Desulfurellales bacterium]|nr:MAG: hypothetical protein E6Q97_17310 [Desulfurellales bacterium]
MQFSFTIGDVLAALTFFVPIIGGLIRIASILSDLRADVRHIMSELQSTQRRLDDHGRRLDDHENHLTRINTTLRLAK